MPTENKKVWNIPDESYGEVGQKGGQAEELRPNETQEKNGNMATFETGIKGGRSSKEEHTTSAADVEASDALNEDILADTELTGDIYEINDDYPEDGEL